MTSGVRTPEHAGWVEVRWAEGFVQQPQVLNGASDLLVEIFGASGRHARVAVGAAELPRGASVEIEVIFSVS